MRMVLAIWLALSALAGRSASEPAQEPIVFEKHIRPILKANCFQCHGEEAPHKGKLDARRRRSLIAGGRSGPAIVPGSPADSLLLQRVEQQEMPPGNKKLSAEEVALLRRWVQSGAATARPEHDGPPEADPFTHEDRSHWSFQPIQRPPVPAVKQLELVRTPIDAFLLARLESQGLSYSPPADKRTLLRRASFDLTGLPPTPAETELFLADNASDAFDRLIDRLLTSPHYGERWGRHWLDVAGYADSEGYTSDDAVRKEAFKYRDYIIQSLNADKPFDQFICEQLAGDELLPPEIIASGYKNLSADSIEKLIATGFLRMAPDGTGSGNVDQNLARNQVIADTIRIVSSSLFGLTVGCAQCHDHRYDPITQADYYRLRAVFEPAFDWKNWRVPAARRVSLYTDSDRARAAEIEAEAAKIDAQRAAKQQEFIEATFDKELAKLPEHLRDAARIARNTPAANRSDDQKQLLKEHPSLNVSAGSLYLYDQKAADELKKMADEAAGVRARKPVEEFVRSLTEVPGTTSPTFLFVRGDHDQPGQAVTPGDLSILADVCTGEIPEDNPALPTSGRRLAFARKLTNGTHPLVARVLVNRAWMHHFGQGIAAKPADFGFLGEPPSHPELLDWLAMEFMNPSGTPPYEGGKGAWKLKRLHKLIMTSNAYRQGSSRPEGSADGAGEQNTAASRDPDNRLLWRVPVRRLEAESIRDSVLAVSGKLNIRMFGPPVPIREDEVGQVVVGVDTTDSAGRPTGKEVALEGEENRRSIYVQVRRSKPLALLDTFDEPAMEPNCDARNRSTVAPQALLLMNNDFIIAQSRYFAERVVREVGDDPERAVRRAWQLAFARDPGPSEQSDSAAFVRQQADYFRAHPAAQAAAGKEEKESPAPELRAIATLCHALLSSNEFLYVD